MEARGEARGRPEEGRDGKASGTARPGAPSRQGRSDGGIPLGIPGEELPKVSHKLDDAVKYSDSDILIVGGGDFAIRAAIALSHAERNRVTLSYRGDQFQRGPERNRKLIETAEKEKKVIFSGTVAWPQLRPILSFWTSTGGPQRYPTITFSSWWIATQPSILCRPTPISAPQKAFAEPLTSQGPSRSAQSRWSWLKSTSKHQSQDRS